MRDYLKRGLINMRICEARCEAFGKYSNFTVNFKPGLNIVYGDNEAGKTTLINFVFGMLYGFVRPELRIRRMLPEYRYYRPWKDNQYKGALIFEHLQRQYLCERDWNKHHISIYDNESNENLTGQYAISPYTKELLFMEAITGISAFVYKSILTWNAGHAIYDERLITNIDEYFIKDTNDTQKYYTDVMEIIKHHIHELGSELTIMRPLGRLNQELSELKRTRKVVERSYQKQRHVQQVIHELNAELKKLKAERLILSRAIEEWEDQCIYQRSQEAEVLYEDISFLEQQKAQYHTDKFYSHAYIEDVGQRSAKIATLEQSIKEAKIQRGKSTTKLAQLMEEQGLYSVLLALDGEERAGYIKSSQRLCQVSESLASEKKNLALLQHTYTEHQQTNLQMAQNLVDRVSQLEVQHQENLTEDLETQLEKQQALIEGLDKTRNEYKPILDYMLWGLCFGLIGGAFYQQTLIFAAPIVLPGVLIYQRYHKRKQIDAKKTKLNIEITSLTEQKERLEHKQQAVEHEIKELLDEIHVPNINVFHENKHQYEKQQQELKQLQHDIEQCQSKIATYNKECLALTEHLHQVMVGQCFENISEDDINNLVLNFTEQYELAQKWHEAVQEAQQEQQAIAKNLSSLEDELQRQRMDQARILVREGFTDINSFQEKVQKQQAIEKIESLLTLKRNQMHKVIGNMSYASFAKQCADWQQGIFSNIINYDAENIINKKQRLKTIEKKCELLHNKRLDLRQLLESITKGHVNLSELDVHIDIKEKKLAYLLKQKQLLQMTLQIFSHLVEEMEVEFAPRFNEQASAYLSFLTLNKYQQISINSHLQATLYNPVSYEPISEHSLSTATREQIYLSIRLALADLLLENKYIPLLLDDVFVHYDNDRLRQALKLLESLTEKRQIILLTSSQRERDLLNALNITYNNIHLPSQS